MTSAAALNPSKPNFARDNGLAMALLVALGVMLVPMPPIAMDLLLAANISLSLLVVLTVLNTPRPMEFSTFPSVLLFAAVFRLALNVATTRLILGNQGEAGSIIRTFGDFVVGGNHVVGIVVFLILVVIQFVVITRGQNRISEVAARFTLDAMPGKQMAIDADLNSGVISNEEARQRRADLSNEAQFYGAMDGAGKFVRGDAIAALVITAINLLGGVVIGVFQRGLPAGDAFQAYALLTIGDGLVSQIPALMVSTSAGVLTSKGASDSGLGSELSGQLFDSPAVLRTGAFLVGAMALLPGMPTLLFLGLGGALYWYAGRRAEHGADAERQAADSAAAEAAKKDPEAELEDLLAVDRLCIEIGYRLVPLVDDGRHGGLLDHVRALRAQIAGSLGIVVPPIRIRDDARLDGHDYRILLHGQEIARGSVHAGQWLAMDPGGVDPNGRELRGIDTIEPAFGLPAKWIVEGDRDRAEALGFTVIDAPSVLTTHLAEILRKFAPELLTRDDVKALCDNLKRTAPAVVEELVPSRLTIGQIQQVLTRLLAERVPVKNLQVILESLADHATDAAQFDARALAERARTALARAICEPYLDDEGTLHAAVVEPQLEKALADAISGRQGLDQLPPGFLARFVDGTAEALAELVKDGRDPVLITRASLRPFLADAVTGVVPNAAVLSYQESAVAKRVETRSRVTVPA